MRGSSAHFLFTGFKLHGNCPKKILDIFEGEDVYRIASMVRASPENQLTNGFMRTAFLTVLYIHALIHLMWFAHAFDWIDLPYFQKDIPGMVGFSWLLAAVFFIWAAIRISMRKPKWFLPALVGVLLSQMWIFSAWSDTQYGSFANLLILGGILVGYAKWSFEERFREEAEALLEYAGKDQRILTEKELEGLPKQVVQYVRRSGAIGKPVVENFRLEFEGEMRQKGKPWFSFTSEQYNFIQNPSRLFFMKGRIKGLSVWGYHTYRPPRAKMVIRALSLVPQVKIDSPEMYPTETVTFLNDLCLFAPGALADDRIQYAELDASRVQATFSLKDLKVTAVLHFDAQGDLINFSSEDRTDVSKMERLPFTTPVKDYREFDGMRLPSYGEAVWHYPEGEFVYGKFRLKAISYNLTGLADTIPNRNGLIGET